MAAAVGGRFGRIVNTALAFLLLLGLVTLGRGAVATHRPADKVGVGASTLEIMSTQVGEGITDQPKVEILSGTMKVSSPTDLIITVSSECALWTNTTTQGDDDQESVARVEVWIELDGTVVPVSSGDTAANNSSLNTDTQAGKGHVVYCNRSQRMKTEFFNDGDTQDNQEEIIRLYNRTRSAHAFTWVALNAGKAYDAAANGNNIIEYKVYARLAAQVICDDEAATNGCNVPDLETPQNPAAKAAVGKRTVVIEPAKLANDATF